MKNFETEKIIYSGESRICQKGVGALTTQCGTDSLLFQTFYQKTAKKWTKRGIMHVPDVPWIRQWILYDANVRFAT